MMEERKPDAHTRVPRQELFDAVSFARKFSCKGIPVLDSVKLTIQDDGDVIVYATDLETGVVSSIEADGVYGENPIELLVDKKKLADTLKSLKDDSVVLEFFAGEEVPNVCPGCGTTEFDAPPVDGTDESVKADAVLTPSPVPGVDVKTSSWDEKACAKCGHVGKSNEFYPENAQAELRVGKFFTLRPNLDVDEFPELHEFPEQLETAATTTVSALRKVVVATINNGGDFALSGVNFSKEDGLMVATDNHRMHTVTALVQKDFMLDGKMLKTLMAGKKDDDELTFSFPVAEPIVDLGGLKKAELIAMWEKRNSEKLPNSMTIAEIEAKFEAITCVPKNVHIVDGNREITMRLMENTFPNYKAVMNREDLQEIVVKAGVLREGMKQALALTATTEMAVKVSFNGSIDLGTVVEGDSYNRASVEIVSGGIEPPVSHNYNARYISDILSLFKDDVDLTLSVPEEQKPLLFNDNAGFEGLVMPAREL